MTFTLPQNAVYQYTKSIAELAYIYGYALISLWILMSNDVNNKAPFNQMYYSTGLTTPTYFPFRGPNSDAVYATAWLDLTNTPILINTPDTRQQNRWWTVQLLDVYTNTFANLPGTDKNKPPKQYYVVGPEWDDEDYILPDGVNLVKAPSNIVYLVSRTEVKNDDVTSALYVMGNITIAPVIPGSAVLQIAPITNNTALFNSLDFYVTLMQILNYNLPGTEDVILNLFSSIGLLPSTLFNYANLPAWTLQAFTESVDTALHQIIPFGYQWATGIVYVGSWQGGTKNGVFGDDYVRRAFANFAGPAANIPQEQFYVYTTQDSNLTPLNGSAHNYLIHFPAGTYPDVNKKWGFWSLTVYTPTQQLYANSINRYAVGSNNHDLVYNTDGSLDIYIQNTQPVGTNPSYANWLPCPAGTFNMILRMYSPSDAQIASPTNVPPVQRNDPPVY